MENQIGSFRRVKLNCIGEVFWFVCIGFDGIHHLVNGECHLKSDSETDGERTRIPSLSNKNSKRKKNIGSRNVISIPFECIIQIINDTIDNVFQSLHYDPCYATMFSTNTRHCSVVLHGHRH